MPVFPARLGLAPAPDDLPPRQAVLAQSPQQRPASPRESAEIVDQMIQELLGQPGELHFHTGPVAPPSAAPDTPSHGAPAALLLLRADERDVEAGIAVMRQRGLGRDAAERAVGLPPGVLAAVVDEQAHWLDEQAQSHAARGLSGAQLQQLAHVLDRMRDHLQGLPGQAAHASGSSHPSMPPLQEHEVGEFIHELLQQPQPGGFDATVRDLAARHPRQERESLAAWAKRIHASEATVQALPFKARISVLAAVTGAKAVDLRREPALQDADPELGNLARAIRDRVPPQPFEGPAAHALRIYQTDDAVRGLPQDTRIKVLAIVTGARQGSLRSMPGLCDIPASMASWVEGIRTRVPRREFAEGRVDWARRIHRTDAQVQVLPYRERITALSLVTGMREADLRSIPSLRDASGPLGRQAEDVRRRTPQLEGEPKRRWARRLNETDPVVRSLPYSRRIALLAMVTDVKASDLRGDPALKDAPGGAEASGPRDDGPSTKP